MIIKYMSKVHYQVKYTIIKYMSKVHDYQIQSEVELFVPTILNSKLISRIFSFEKKICVLEN